MIKLNRTTEYGLMALRHMSKKQLKDAHEVTSAREISDTYGLPFEITAKTLLRLKDTGLIQSAQGAKGGYTLQRPLEKVSLGEFLEMMEGPQTVVACASLSDHPSEMSVKDGSAEWSECEYGTRCEIKHLMKRVNERVFSLLAEIPLAELTHDSKLDVQGIESHAFVRSSAPAEVRSGERSLKDHALK